MLYYKNIAKFTIKCDGVDVKPGETHETNHFINSKYMFRVDAPKVEIVEPIVEDKSVERVEYEKGKSNPKVEDGLTVLAIPKPVKQTRRRTTKTAKNNNINKENNSEEVDNG